MSIKQNGGVFGRNPIFNKVKATQVNTDTLDVTNDAVVGGNVVISTSGKGIDFSATAGTGTSELLDDYEEGTWTPVLVGTTAVGIGTYSRQYGYYTKVGNTVTVNIALSWSAHTGTGNMRMEGLPFNTFSHPNNTVVAVGAIVPSGITYLNEIRIASRRNSAQIVIYSVATGSSQADVPIDTAGSIYASMTYQTDD